MGQDCRIYGCYSWQLTPVVPSVFSHKCNLGSGLGTCYWSVLGDEHGAERPGCGAAKAFPPASGSFIHLQMNSVSMFNTKAEIIWLKPKTQCHPWVAPAAFRSFRRVQNAAALDLAHWTASDTDPKSAHGSTEVSLGKNSPSREEFCPLSLDSRCYT